MSLPSRDGERTSRTLAAVSGPGAGDVAASEHLALVTTRHGAVLATPDRTWPVPGDELAAVLRRVDAEVAPRWVWWSAGATTTTVLRADPSLRLRRCWDLAAVHRILHGGHADDPAHVWAGVAGLDVGLRPTSGQLDLLRPDGDDGDPLEPVRPDGHLRPDWADGGWALGPDDQVGRRGVRWARLALEAAEHQLETLRGLDVGGDAVHTAWSESAAALVAVELGATGLPVHRETVEDVVRQVAGPRPESPADEAGARAGRDAGALALLPDTDLRNPAAVRAALARLGFDLPDTRSWRLERLGPHPAVEALLAWRKAERMVTTYGYRWLDAHLGDDGRLRGAWSGSDGGAGRMTALAGLHSMPRELRVAVRAEPGHLLVRADLGQVEPRVLAAVSGDPALAAAAREDDLYARVAAQLGVERGVAKVAVLAAMYGQTSGAAGEALRDMERTYPVALAYLRRAQERGRDGVGVRTFGGRLVPMWPVEEVPPEAGAAAVSAYRAVLASRGRFARNAVVQGAAAELFKAWTAGVRARLAAAGAGEVVLCLHDELLLHVWSDAAVDVAAEVVDELGSTATRWARCAARGVDQVRFVADVRVIERWSDAKD